MMITPSDLDRLVRHPGGGVVASLYLNVTPPRNYLSELNSLIHARREDLARPDSIARDETRAAADLLDRLAERERNVGNASDVLLALSLGPHPLGIPSERRKC